MTDLLNLLTGVYAAVSTTTRRSRPTPKHTSTYSLRIPTN